MLTRLRQAQPERKLNTSSGRSNKEGFDLCAQATNELGDVGVAGLAVATDGDKLNVAQTGLLNSAAGDQSLAVGQQNDLEHDAWIVSTGIFNPIKAHRIKRVLRRPADLLDFLTRAAFAAPRWLPDAAQRVDLQQQAAALWRPRRVM